MNHQGISFLFPSKKLSVSMFLTKYRGYENQFEHHTTLILIKLIEQNRLEQ